MQPQSALAPILKHQSTDPLLNPNEAAEFLDVAEKSLAVWRCTGRYSIPFYKVGRHVKYRKSDLEAWLESRCRSNGATA